MEQNEEKIMRIIISGSSGFLGKHILERLAGSDMEIYALTSQIGTLAGFCEGFSNIKVSGRDALHNREIPVSADTVLINCAFPRNTRGENFAVGLDYISELLQDAVDQGIGAVINISSQSVYDPQRDYAADEESPVIPSSLYAVGKYASEMVTRAVCRDRSYTNIRLASLIGPGFDQRVVNKLVKFAISSGRISVKDNAQRFGFLDVEDAVSGILSILDLPAENWSNVYNLGGNQTYSLVEIARSIVSVFSDTYQKKVEVEIQKDDSAAKLNTALDCSRLQKEAGYRQNITLEESIRRIAGVCGGI